MTLIESHRDNGVHPNFVGIVYMAVNKLCLIILLNECRVVTSIYADNEMEKHVVQHKHGVYKKLNCDHALIFKPSK